MGEFSESNFTISIKIHSAKNGINISLLNVFLVFGKKFTYCLEIKVAMSLLVENCKCSNSAKINLSLKCLFLRFNFQMIMNLSINLNYVIEIYFSKSLESSYSKCFDSF